MKMVITEKQAVIKDKIWQSCKAIGTLVNCWWKSKMISIEKSWAAPQKMENIIVARTMPPPPIGTPN